MFASLALTAALSVTYPATYFHQDIVKLPGVFDSAQAQIAVDPSAIGTAYSDTQSGWLGVQNGMTNLIQVGWQRYYGQTREFVQVWTHGSISSDQWISYDGSKNVNVAIAYQNGIWNVYNEFGNTWSSVWSGRVPFTPQNGVWEVATESYDQNQPSPLCAAVTQSNGTFKPLVEGQF